MVLVELFGEKVWGGEGGGAAYNLFSLEIYRGGEFFEAYTNYVCCFEICRFYI